MTEHCIIFAGGDPVSSETFHKFSPDNAYVIAADKGVALAKSLGIEADLILGDFDSLGYRPQGDSVLSYPVEKDDTDLMLAVNEGLARGHRDFYIFGACGGRLDHMVGNIRCLALLLENGAQGIIIGDTERVSLHRAGEYTFPYEEGFSLSFFAHSEKVTDLCISGTKYTADNVTLKNASTLGVSNEINSPFAKVSFSDGILLAVRSKL